ncbi:MAG: hypothetical protein GVY18_16775 [Bacteroidetes bacterium]|nr:hypothetical protein [Bacteroidota bacterium]
MALLLLGLCTHPCAQAQQPTAPYGEWAALSVGSQHPDAISLALGYQTTRWDLPARVSFGYNGDFPFGGRPDIYALTLHGQTGWRHSGLHHLMAQFVGLSLGYRTERSEVPTTDGRLREITERQLIPGLSATAQFILKPLAPIAPELGLGVELFGNLNLVQSHYGLRVALVVHNTL